MLIQLSVNGKPISKSAYGRYAASRPHCSMADVSNDTDACKLSRRKQLERKA